MNATNIFTSIREQVSTQENNSDFPYVWEKRDASPETLVQVFKENYDEIRQRLLTNGAVLFRSFGIENPERLEEAVNAFPGKSVNYAGGNSPRTNVKGKVYTSTEHPAHAHISLHNEMSYACTWPEHIFFCCQTPALEGGNTSIANSRQILADLSEETSNAFREKGVLYIRNLHGGIGPGASWQDTFETQSSQEVEAHCRANDIEFRWSGKENLRLIEKRQGTLIHPGTMDEVWFNQADQFHPSTNGVEIFEALMEIYEDDPMAMPQYVCFGDGSAIPMAMLDEIREVYQKNTVLFTWEKGDLLMLDNVLSAHGRTPFVGPRKILVSMSS